MESGNAINRRKIKYNVKKTDWERFEDEMKRNRSERYLYANDKAYEYQQVCEKV